jgi:adenine deaminase
MLIPSEFARVAVRHGTVATVSDPHEIANVCGRAGVDFMIANGKQVPFKFYFGAPSCVPATPFETAGAKLDLKDVLALLEREDIHYLSEMMNWPAVLNNESSVIDKIQAALQRNKPVDGHAPGLRGEDARKYISAGISTDHECTSRAEALDKLKYGMKIIIREGSAARNFEDLISLLDDYPQDIMFCSDDKHPDDLLQGHINKLVARALHRGKDQMAALQAASVLPVEHYGLDVGLLQKGDPADFIVVDKLQNMEVLQTWIEGNCVFDGGNTYLPEVKVKPINNFVSYLLSPKDFEISSANRRFPVIEAFEGSVLTGKTYIAMPEAGGKLLTSPEQDILKIAVVNRYKQAAPGLGFIKNFGIKEGALASSVAHDSHNIVAVGSSDHYLSQAVNLLMQSKGGVVVVKEGQQEILPLPIGGIMSNQPAAEVAANYEKLNTMARAMGSTFQALIMTLSFMALLVIPSLKISDQGLFDADKFEFIY